MTPDTKNTNSDKLAAQLEALLQELLQAHETLGALVLHKRQALGRAEHDHVVQLLGQENQCVQTISELEKRRLQMVADLTLAVVPDAAEPLMLADLAQHLAEPVRGRLLVLRQQLRQRMQRIKADTGVARRATEALVQHMRGLVQTISAVCTAAGVYGPGGAPPDETAAVSTFNATA
jgi:hypothetical protein